jgi:hypothetical protein
MGVDLSTTVGIGFAIDPDALEAFRKRVDPDGNLYSEELFYGTDLKKWSDTFAFGEAGSYYGSDDIQAYIYLRRGSENHDMHDLPGGIFGLNRPVITLEEREAFNAIASELGMDSPEIGQFLAVLWH